jgi:hypothetical protein
LVLRGLSQVRPGEAVLAVAESEIPAHWRRRQKERVVPIPAPQHGSAAGKAGQAGRQEFPVHSHQRVRVRKALDLQVSARKLPQGAGYVHQSQKAWVPLEEVAGVGRQASAMPPRGLAGAAKVRDAPESG